MANSAMHLQVIGGLRCRTLARVALVLGLAAVCGTAAAQQAPKAPPPTKTPAPAQKGAAAPPAQPANQSAWVKLCEKASTVRTDKDGKEEKRDLNICLTHHERLDGNSGMVLVSAAVRQIEGQDKQYFMVMVPLGMLLQPGMRASLYSKDLWEKAQKHEKIDETKLKTIKLSYTLCHPAGCTAELEATPELLTDLKTDGGLVVVAVNASGQPVAFPVPLVGFDQSYAGEPVDAKQYGEARRALMQQIQARQQALFEEQKKKYEEEQKKAPPPAKK
jgi:invasion protein IalB